MRRCNVFHLQNIKIVTERQNRQWIADSESGFQVLVLQSLAHTCSGTRIVPHNFFWVKTTFTNTWHPLKLLSILKARIRTRSSDISATETNFEMQFGTCLDDLIPHHLWKFQLIWGPFASFTRFWKFRSVLKVRIRTQIVGYFGTGVEYRQTKKWDF